MGVRALWWLQHYVQQVRPQLLVNPHCNALFVAMDGLAGLQAMLGHASVESTQIYTQVSIRALQAVHASTHPAEQQEENMPTVADEK